MKPISVGATNTNGSHQGIPSTLLRLCLLILCLSSLLFVGQCKTLKVPNLQMTETHTMVSEEEPNTITVSNVDSYAHEKVSAAESRVLEDVPTTTDTPSKPPYSFQFGNGMTSDSDYVFNTGSDGKLKSIRSWGVTFPFKGIDFLGRGYNIFSGSPKAIDVGGDMGFMEKVFLADTSAEEGTEDWRHVKPKNIEIYTRVTCSLDFKSTTVSSSSSLQSTYDNDVSESTSVGVEASFSGWGANVDASFNGRWTGSKSFKGMSQSLQKHNSLYIFSEAQCSLYEARIQKHVRPQLSNEFKTAVSKLPASYDPDSYVQFIRTFGTHVLVGGLFGSKMGRIYEMTSTEAEKLQSQGTSLSKSSSIAAKISGGYSGFGADVSASGSYGSDSSSNSNTASEAANSFRSATTSEKIYSIGALPPENGDARQWAAEVAKDEAMPIRYELMPIGNVVAYIDNKKGGYFSQAYSDYVKMNTDIEEIQDDAQIGQCYMSKVHRSAYTETPSKSMVAECADGYDVISGSTYTALNHPRNELTELTYKNALNWAFPSASNQFIVGSGNPSLEDKTAMSSIGYTGALCCKSDSSLKTLTVRSLDTVESPEEISASRSSSINVECPAGYGVVSGGFMIMDVEEDRYVEVLTNAASSESSWECRLAWTTAQFNIAPKFACYARCASLNGSPLKCESNTKKLSADQGSYLSCLNGNMATGLGWKVLNRQTPISRGEVYHVDTTLHRYTTITGPRAGVFYIGSLNKTMEYEAQLRCCNINNNQFEPLVEEHTTDECTKPNKDYCTSGYLAGFEVRGIDFWSLKPICCNYKTTPARSDMECLTASTDAFKFPSTKISATDGYFLTKMIVDPSTRITTTESCRPRNSQIEGGLSCYTKNVKGLLTSNAEVQCDSGYRLTEVTRGEDRQNKDIESFTCCLENQGTPSLSQSSFEYDILGVEAPPVRCQTVSSEQLHESNPFKLKQLTDSALFSNKKTFRLTVEAVPADTNVNKYAHLINDSEEGLKISFFDGNVEHLAFRFYDIPLRKEFTMKQNKPAGDRTFDYKSSRGYDDVSEFEISYDNGYVKLSQDGKPFEARYVENSLPVTDITVHTDDADNKDSLLVCIETEAE